MFPMDKIKKEVCDENSEMDSKEFKIEVKMEDIDPSDVPNIDNNFSNAGCVKTETDFEALFVKDEFEREIVEQQLQNNDETINVPVLLDGSEVKPNLPSKKLVVLPKKVYMDMKSKKKTEVITPNLPGPSNSICGAALDAVLSEPGPTCVNKNRRIFSHQRMKAYEVFVAYKKTGLSKSRSVAMTAADMGFSKVTMWRCIKEMETTRVQSPSKQVITPSLPGPSNSICGAALDAVLSEPCPTSINKNRRGKLIFSDQRMKAYEVFVAYKKTGLSKSRSVAMTAADMGFSENTVWRCVKEMETTGRVQSPSSKRKRRQLFHKLDDKQRETLRQITDSFLERKERPSLNKINRACELAGNLPVMGKKTLWQSLQSIGFSWEKRRGRPRMQFD